MITLTIRTILIYYIISSAFNYVNAKADSPMEKLLGDKNRVTIQIYKRPDGGIAVYNDLGKVFETITNANEFQMMLYIHSLGYKVIVTEEYINQRRKP